MLGAALVRFCKNLWKWILLDEKNRIRNPVSQQICILSYMLHACIGKEYQGIIEAPMIERNQRNLIKEDKNPLAKSLNYFVNQLLIKLIVKHSMLTLIRNGQLNILLSPLKKRNFRIILSNKDILSLSHFLSKVSKLQMRFANFILSIQIN